MIVFLLVNVKLSSWTWQQKLKKTASFVEANIALHRFPSVVTRNYRCLNKSDSEIQSWMLVVVWYEMLNYINFMYMNSYYVR